MELQGASLKFERFQMTTWPSIKRAFWEKVGKRSQCHRCCRFLKTATVWTSERSKLFWIEPIIMERKGASLKFERFQMTTWPSIKRAFWEKVGKRSQCLRCCRFLKNTATVWTSEQTFRHRANNNGTKEGQPQIWKVSNDNLAPNQKGFLRERSLIF